MSKNRSNIAALCTRHAAHPAGIGDLAPESLIGAHVKVLVKVPEPAGTEQQLPREHIWIKVAATKKSRGVTCLMGHVDIVPSFADQFHYGQPVTVSPNHVEDYFFRGPG